MHYVFVYEKADKLISDVREFAEGDRRDAIACRAKLRLKYRADNGVEIDMLSASSFEALQKRESRYAKALRAFKTSPTTTANL